MASRDPPSQNATTHHIGCMADRSCSSVSSTDAQSKPNSEPSDDQNDLDIKHDIFELEERIAAIDLSVSSTQRSLEDIYRSRRNANLSHNPPFKLSFLRRTRSFLNFIGFRPLQINPQIKFKSPSSPTAHDDEITQAEGTIQHLIEERQALTFDLVHRKAELTNRHEKLPVELWARIFLLCLPDEEFITPDPLRAPLLLCQVCSRWKNIATSTPFLWNTLSICSSYYRPIWKSFLEIWLKRSGNARLYLNISITVERDMSSVDHHLFKSILATSDRWRHLRLNLSRAFLHWITKRYMPRLRTLEICNTEYIMNFHIHPYQAPKLRSVSFLTKTVYLHAHILPWRQLTHLDSKCWLNIAQHAEILANCPNLQSYSMSLIHMPLNAQWIYETMKIFHPRVKILKIITFIDNFTDATIDFNPFQLPKLSELILIIPYESPAYGVLGWPKAELLSLIQRSSCSLTKLHLRGICMTENDISSVQELIHLPNVDLSVQDPSITFSA